MNRKMLSVVFTCFLTSQSLYAVENPKEPLPLQYHMAALVVGLFGTLAYAYREKLYDILERVAAFSYQENLAIDSENAYPRSA